MSLDSLAARLTIDKSTLYVVTEGVQDARLITGWIEENIVPAVCYPVEDIEVVLSEEYRRYGGNKGRVITLFASGEVATHSDRSAVGLIDVDLDDVLTRRVSVKGVYYTEHACLFSMSILQANLDRVLKTAFGSSLPVAVWKEIESFSRRYFVVRSLKQRLAEDVVLPDIDRSIRKTVEGGFDWDGYNVKVAAVTSGRVTAAEIDAAFSGIDWAADVRCSMHYHSVLQYITGLLRRDGLVPGGITEGELSRHLRVILVGEFFSGNVSAIIAEKAESLQCASA
jgi:hypothetical protein